jgi:hypothetical protein
LSAGEGVVTGVRQVALPRGQVASTSGRANGDADDGGGGQDDEQPAAALPGPGLGDDGVRVEGGVRRRSHRVALQAADGGPGRAWGSDRGRKGGVPPVGELGRGW